MALLRNIDKYVQWDERRKMYVPVYWRREILPNWMYFDFSDVGAAAAVIPAAGTPSAPFTFKQPYTSVGGLDENLGTPFEVRSIVFADTVEGTPAANFQVLLKEVGETREFMNRRCHVRTIFGTAQTPALLREPFMFKSQHNVSCQFFKIAGGATAAKVYLVGAQYAPWSPEFMAKKRSHTELVDIVRKWYKRRNYVTPYWLTTDEDVTLAGNASGEFFAKIGDDGHFEAFTLTAVSTGNFEIDISEPKTKQTLMNGLITQTNGIGNANFPTLLASAYLVPAGYRLRFFIRNLTGAENNIFITLSGRKIWVPFKSPQGRVVENFSVPTPADTPTQMVPSPF